MYIYYLIGSQFLKKLFNFQIKKRVKLEGIELEEYYIQENEKEKEKQERLRKSKELE